MFTFMISLWITTLQFNELVFKLVTKQILAFSDFTVYYNNIISFLLLFLYYVFCLLTFILQTINNNLLWYHTFYFLISWRLHRFNLCILLHINNNNFHTINSSYILCFYIYFNKLFVFKILKNFLFPNFLSKTFLSYPYPKCLLLYFSNFFEKHFVSTSSHYSINKEFCNYCIF